MHSFSARISPGIGYRNAFKLIFFVEKSKRANSSCALAEKLSSSLSFIFKTNYTRITRERVREREAKINDWQNHVLSTTSFVPIAELLFIIFSQSLIPNWRYLKQMCFLHQRLTFSVCDEPINLNRMMIDTLILTRKNMLFETRAQVSISLKCSSKMYGSKSAIASALPGPVPKWISTNSTWKTKQEKWFIY